MIDNTKQKIRHAFEGVTDTLSSVEVRAAIVAGSSLVAVFTAALVVMVCLHFVWLMIAAMVWPGGPAFVVSPSFPWFALWLLSSAAFYASGRYFVRMGWEGDNQQKGQL